MIGANLHIEVLYTLVVTCLAILDFTVICIKNLASISMFEFDGSRLQNHSKHKNVGHSG